MRHPTVGLQVPLASILSKLGNGATTAEEEEGTGVGRGARRLWAQPQNAKPCPVIGTAGSVHSVDELPQLFTNMQVLSSPCKIESHVTGWTHGGCAGIWWQPAGRGHCGLPEHPRSLHS